MKDESDEELRGKWYSEEIQQSGTMTTRSRKYLNDKQRQMAPENYLLSGEIILQNIIRGLKSKT